MYRKYIQTVEPLDDFVLLIDFTSGSRLLLDMKPHLDSIRFRSYKRLILSRNLLPVKGFLFFIPRKIVFLSYIPRSNSENDNSPDEPSSVSPDSLGPFTVKKRHTEIRVPLRLSIK